MHENKGFDTTKSTACEVVMQGGPQNSTNNQLTWTALSSQFIYIINLLTSLRAMRVISPS